jgi:hypothetical protein
MKFEVLTAVKMSTVVFQVVTPCGFVDGYQCFGGTYYLHLQGCHFINPDDEDRDSL